MKNLKTVGGMSTYLEEKIKYFDEEYRAGRALITDTQFDQLKKTHKNRP